MSQPREIGSWGVSALQGHSDPRWLGMVPTAAWSILCWSPCHRQGCQFRDFLCFKHHHPERKLIRFHFHQKLLFNISSVSLGLKLKFLQKLRPVFSPSWMLQGCSSADTAGSTWKLSLLRPGKCFPGVTGAIRAFEGNVLCGNWLRNKV